MVKRQNRFEDKLSFAHISVERCKQKRVEAKRNKKSKNIINFIEKRVSSSQRHSAKHSQ